MTLAVKITLIGDDEKQIGEATVIYRSLRGESVAGHLTMTPMDHHKREGVFHLIRGEREIVISLHSLGHVDS